MDDTDALELIGLEAFVLGLLGSGPRVVPDDPDAAEDETDASPAS
jgi:hypothetical protein